MQFGGHETFPLREGWLHKGLSIVREDPRAFDDEFVSDRLGVGRNMAKSIRHWIEATGLVEPRVFDLGLTPLGEAVWSADPYLLSPLTWWLVHVELATNEDSAYSWRWFFNSFHAERFEKPTCVEALRRQLAFVKSRVPKDETLLRDVGCMLACYARPVPEQREDPEDSRHAPLVELGLMDHYRESGLYRVHRGPKRVPTAVIGYAIVRAFERTKLAIPESIPLHDLARMDGGPARTLCLSSESLYQTIEDAVNAERKPAVSIEGLAGQRMVALRWRKSLEFAKAALAESREECHVG
jgi:hypothetical protein